MWAKYRRLTVERSDTNSQKLAVTFQSQHVTLRTIRFNIQEFYLVFTGFVWVQERTSFSLYNMDKLVFITEVESVYSAVRAGSLNTAVCASYLEGLTF